MIKSFLMIGQSNMAGRGFVTDVPPICNEKIQMLRNGRWQMMAEPINYDRPVAGVGLAASFADALTKLNMQDTIGLIPCAEGGSSLDEWSVDGVLFRNAISQTKLAMESSELSGILWHQGENDCFNENYKVYYQKFLKIIETLRQELNVPNVPIIIGGMPDFLGKQGFGQGCIEFDQVDKELQKFAFEQPHCYFVTAKGLTSNPDGIHIDATSQRKFGLRYYEAFWNKKHVTVPLSNENDFTNEHELTNNEKIYLLSTDFAFGKMTYEEYMSQVTKLSKG